MHKVLILIELKRCDHARLCRSFSVLGFSFPISGSHLRISAIRSDVFDLQTPLARDFLFNRSTAILAVGPTDILSVALNAKDAAIHPALEI
jgi:hypothetical protein